MVGLVVDDQDLALAVTTSRSICPETSAGGCPGRSSRPAIETSARLPGANTGAKRGIRDQGQHLRRQRLALGLGPVAGVAGEIPQRRLARGPRRRHRAAIAAAGAPACRAACARARDWIDSPRSDRMASSSAAGSDGRSRLSAAAPAWPAHAAMTAAAQARRRSVAAAPAGRRILGPRIALHHAVTGRDLLQLQSELPRPLSIRSYQENSRTLFMLPGMQPRDDQAVGRARHRHIEQAAIFVLGLVQHRVARRPRPRRDRPPSCRPRPRPCASHCRCGK